LNSISWSLLFLLISVSVPGGAAVHKDLKKIVKTYLPFTLPVDPANVRTLVDLDLSYALASTLVGWSPTRELVSGLAESWKPTGEREMTFTLSEKAKWSDGTPVTADHVVKSLMRAKQVHGDSLKTLFELVQKIEAADSRSILFKLHQPVAKSGLVRKLTEPMYGVVRVKPDSTLDLTKSSGPFTLQKVSESEVVLAVNKLWVSNRPDMPDSVVIRRPPPGDDLQDAFLKDSWANLLGASSLIAQSTGTKYEQAKFAIWSRDLDKVFFLAPSPKMVNEEGRGLIRFLNGNLRRPTLMHGLRGFTLADQFFPKGYILFDPEFVKNSGPESVPKEFQKRPLVILGAQSRLNAALQVNLCKAIKESLGLEPKFKVVPLNEFEKARAEGNYDILAGSLPVNDPNVEGAMGFFFGLTPPIIANAGQGEKDFGARISAARKLEDQLARNLEYRKVFTMAVREGTLLPLFHYSTIVVAKEGIDLSLVPTTDETVAFSKVRFK
jgi:ABC-type transport system substrate-binding protein